jgi:hypothetical protein
MPTVALFAQQRNCSLYSSSSKIEIPYEVNVAEKLLNDKAANAIANGFTVENRTVTLTVPIVFHVVHQNGPENIPDSVIINSVNALNQRFSKSGPYNYSNGVNVNIQFCLASTDPYGNPTNGITRDTSYWSVFPVNSGGNADFMLKNVNRWNPMRYLNVWLPKSTIFAMPSNAYSSYPWYIGMPIDGIVIEALSLGTPHFLLAHEVGHYLGLYHNDEGDSCLNFNCLLDGDHVCDTPPEYRPLDCALSSCSTDLDDTSGVSPFTIDTTDISNLMLPVLPCLDYVFTQGQADRMNYFLSTTRSLLLDGASCNGITPSIPLPTTGIQITGNGCNGYKFEYTGSGAEYVAWDINNDGSIDNSGSNFIYSFPSAGIYTVVQYVFNGAGYSTDSITINALSTNNTNFPIKTITSSNQSNNGNFLCMGSTLTLTAIPNMAHYNWSTGDTTQTIQLTVNGPITVGLSCTDSLGIIWKHCPDSTFSWGTLPTPDPFSLQPLTNDTLCEGELFKALVPSQPGASIWQYLGNGMMTQSLDTVIISYWNSQSTWISIVMATPNYCKRYSDTLNMTFSKTIPGPLYPGQNGLTLWITDSANFHQWYLDGILIQGITSDTINASVNGCYTYSAWDIDSSCSTISDPICITTADIKEYTNNETKLYPNPIENYCYFETKAIKINQLRLFDLTGRVVPIKIEEITENKLKILFENVAPGLYFFVTDKIRKTIVVK